MIFRQLQLSTLVFSFTVLYYKKKNGFCCVSNKNYCKTRKRPRSSAITGQRTQFSHLLTRRQKLSQSIPESILTDRGCEFDNKALSALANELGIDKKRICPIHPQANGTVERFNRTLGEMLRKSADHTGENWDLEIPNT